MLAIGLQPSVLCHLPHCVVLRARAELGHDRDVVRWLLPRNEEAIGPQCQVARWEWGGTG